MTTQEHAVNSRRSDWPAGWTIGSTLLARIHRGPSGRRQHGAFSDQFKVGDGVPSGDSPIVVVQANNEEYVGTSHERIRRNRMAERRPVPN